MKIFRFHTFGTETADKEAYYGFSASGIASAKEIMDVFDIDISSLGKVRLEEETGKLRGYIQMTFTAECPNDHLKQIPLFPMMCDTCGEEYMRMDLE